MIHLISGLKTFSFLSPWFCRNVYNWRQAYHLRVPIMDVISEMAHIAGTGAYGGGLPIRKSLAVFNICSHLSAERDKKWRCFSGQIILTKGRIARRAVIGIILFAAYTAAETPMCFSVGRATVRNYLFPWRSHLIHGFLGSPESAPKRHRDRFSCFFLQGTFVWPPQATFVVIGIYLCSASDAA